MLLQQLCFPIVTPNEMVAIIDQTAVIVLFQTAKRPSAPLSVHNGISVHTAYEAYADTMPVSSRTIYDYIDKGVFGDVDNLDLRRKVRRKPFRKKSGKNPFWPRP